MASESLVTIALAVGLVVAAAWLLYRMLHAWEVRRRGVERTLDSNDPVKAPLEPNTARPSGPLATWLSLAGYRRPDAVWLFAASSIAALIGGVLLALAFSVTILTQMIRTVGDIPGGIGEALVAILQAGPWLVFVVIAFAPVLIVRAARRRRVREIEQDLPIVLELFATLAQAGLGFDAALLRIVQSQPRSRPLTAELQGFQRDLQAGVARLQALRHLAKRIDVTSMTIFVSAVIHSEQVGASLSETLRHQANDLRDRRRELALLLAQTLPVKLVFPLVGCFLPGVFLSTLGPVLYQMIQVADSVLRSGGR